MANSFTSPDGDLENLYITEYDFIDRYVTTGSLWAWGLNAQGQLGDNTLTSRSSPVQNMTSGKNWSSIAVSVRNTVGIKTDGTLWVWGDNNYGQMGNNLAAAGSYYSSPVQTVAGGTNWKQATTGQDAIAAVKTDGTIWGWGQNTSGQLGDGTLVAKSSPVQIAGGGNNWKQVAINYASGFAIKTDGTLWSWGANTNGQLGDNTRVSKSSPIQIYGGGTNWKTLFSNSNAGQYAGAIKTDGTLWMWGANGFGNLGTNNISSYSSPVQTVSGGSNWKYLALGTRHTCAIKTDGTLWLWGSNTTGQLGTNDLVTVSSPVQTVAGGTNWKMVCPNSSTTYNMTAAIKTDGTLWVWGHNSPFGQLGINTINTVFSSPIQTIAGGTNWKTLSVGGNYVQAIYFYDANDQYPK